jgi:DNA polymerase-3 subunit delta'
MVANLEHPDVHWYFPLERPKGVSGERLVDALEDARHREIAEWRATPLRCSHTDEVRGLYLGTVRNIRSRAHMRPTMAPGPVFIVGQAERLVPQEASQEAANALLKLLEEPPGAARFVLTSSEPGLLLPTIRSRTVPLHVGPLATETISDFLEEAIDQERDLVRWAVTLGQGSMGRALGFLPDDDDQGPLEQLRMQAFDVVMAATAPDAAAGHSLALSFPPAGARKLIDLFGFVEEWIRDLAAAAAGAEESIFNRDAAGKLRMHVHEAALHAVDLPAGFAVVARARELARGNVNPQLTVSGLVRDLRRALVPSGRLEGSLR